MPFLPTQCHHRHFSTREEVFYVTTRQNPA